MSQFELVWAPLILAIIFLLTSFLVLNWRKLRIKKAKGKVYGSIEVFVLSVSFIVLSGISLFIGLFFLITG